MNTDDTPLKAQKVHHGRNVKWFREMQGMKQGHLGEELKMNQQQISRLEAKPVIKDDVLDRVAEALHISADAIRKCDSERAINVFSNNFNEQVIACNNYFNPIDKIIDLYERRLKAEIEKNELLERLLKET